MFRRLYPFHGSLRFTSVANVILITGGIASVVALFNVLYFYGLVAERHFTNAAGVVWYCALPAVLAVTCFAALRFTPAFKHRVSILLLALAALVYASEVIVELIDTNESGSAKNATRDPDAMVAELRGSGVSAVRSVVTPVALYANSSSAVPTDDGPELIALSGIARRKTVACRDAGRWLVYDSDEYGFHNPPELWKAGEVDIAAVGNSWTQGWCVPSDSNFVSLMRVRYPATVNLGMSGQGPLQILGIAREYLSVLQPKIVLWFYFEGNSLRELQEEKKYELLLRYVRSDFRQGLIGRQDEIDQALRAAAEERNGQSERQARTVSNASFAMLRRVIKVTSLRNAFGIVYGADAQTQAALEDLRGPTMELFRDIVADVKSQVSSWGGSLVFVYLPSAERYSVWTRPTLGPDSQQRTRVLQLIADAAIPVIDLHPVFNTRGHLLFRQGRYNEEGNRVVAEHVLDSISSITLN